jgi:hypothetical protein
MEYLTLKKKKRAILSFLSVTHSLPRQFEFFFLKKKKLFVWLFNTSH